jgi:hypothetical protein
LGAVRSLIIAGSLIVRSYRVLRNNGCGDLIIPHTGSFIVADASPPGLSERDEVALSVCEGRAFIVRLLGFSSITIWHSAKVNYGIYLEDIGGSSVPI